MLRIIHTADWHLGHSLHGVSRQWEHEQFLNWLVHTLETEAADALLVAGDIFDSANPSAAAQRLLYWFLAACRKRLPDLDIVLVAGNHDSPARLEAPSPVLSAFGVHAVGALPRLDDGGLDLDRLIVPLRDKDGNVACWCAALPFLRPQDLPVVDGATSPLVAGVQQVHERVVTAMRDRRQPGQTMTATGHCYMAKGRLSELSERKVLGGNQHALPTEVFPSDLDYVALGHLHLAQRVGSETTVRYSGAPLPLSLNEGRYAHQVLRVDLHSGRAPLIQSLPVPRVVEILRLPENGPQPLAELLETLASLHIEPLPEQQRPFLEVEVLLDQSQPELRHVITEALAEVPVRLLRIQPTYPGSGSPLAETVPDVDLDELQPSEVFERCYLRLHDDAPPAELMSAFHELVEAVEGEEG